MIIDDMSSLKRMLVQLKDYHGAVAFDVETDGLNTRKNKIIGLGIFFKTAGYYVHDRDLMKILASCLHGHKLIGWNSYFDLEMIKNNFGENLWDSLHADALMLKHTIDEEPPFGLKETAVRYFGATSKSEQLDLKESIKKNGGSKNEFFKAGVDILAKYCIQDCALTLRLFNKFSADLLREGLIDFFYKDEVMPLYREVTRYMQSEGIPVNVPYIESSLREISVDIAVLESNILETLEPLLPPFYAHFLNSKYPAKRGGSFAQVVAAKSGIKLPRTSRGFSLQRAKLELHGDNPWISYLLGNRELTLSEIAEIQGICHQNSKSGHAFNLNSKHHLKRLFFNILRETPLSKTPTGQPQVDDDFIQDMAKKYEWAATLSDYNKLQKLKATYMERILEAQEGGIFYPQWKQHGTISGRYSGDCQQLPRFAEVGEVSEIVRKYRNRIREFFVAGEGYKIIDADYESLEPHIFSHVSGEEKIQDIFRKNHDFYSTIAIDTENLSGVSADKSALNYLGALNKSKRQRAKAYSLGIPYGMESFKLAKTLEIEQSQADLLIKNYLNAYPKLHNWMKETNNAVKSCMRVNSQAGRIRRYPELRKVLEKWNTQLLENSLDLWQAYNQDEELYAEAKRARRIYKNALDNAKNFQIQSLAASIVNRASIAISRRLRGESLNARIAGQIHDQIIVISAENIIDKVREIVQYEMEGVVELAVRLKAPAVIGTNFADAH